MRLEMSVSRDTSILFPDRCSLAQGLLSFPGANKYEPTTSQTWGLSYCLESSVSIAHLRTLTPRVQADVGKALGFLWVQIRP